MNPTAMPATLLMASAKPWAIRCLMSLEIGVQVLTRLQVIWAGYSRFFFIIAFFMYPRLDFVYMSKSRNSIVDSSSHLVLTLNWVRDRRETKFCLTPECTRHSARCWWLRTEVLRDFLILGESGAHLEATEFLASHFTSLGLTFLIFKLGLIIVIEVESLMR
jgi:hypothetical protein